MAVELSALTSMTMPATLVLALSMLWLWVSLTASSVLVAVILLGLPMLNTRLPPSVPPPVRPEPAVRVVALVA